MQVGETYDAIGAIVCALEYKFSWLNLNYRSPGTRYSCAELVATAFDKAGKILIPDHRHDELVPADFARLLPKSDIKPE